MASASGAGGYGGGGTDEESVGGPNYATVMDARLVMMPVLTGWTKKFYDYIEANS